MDEMNICAMGFWAKASAKSVVQLAPKREKATCENIWLCPKGGDGQ